MTEVEDADGVAADPDIMPVTVEPEVVHEIRFGRLDVNAAAGSELAPIEQPLHAEYWNNGTWQTNGDDDCTSLALASEVELANNDDPDSPVTGDQPIDVGAGTTDLITNTADPLGLVAGRVDLTFAETDEGNTGFVDTTLTLDPNLPWLRHDWDDADGAGDGPFDDDPSARVTFGIFSGDPNWIHFRRAQ